MTYSPCPDCGQYHGIYKPWHGESAPGQLTDAERFGIDLWLSSLETIASAIRQRPHMTTDQLDRFARILRKLTDDVTERIKR